MAQTRELTQRIRGIRQIMKITKAMELVSAAKMRKSVAAALASRGYAVRAWEMLLALSEATDPNLHPLLAKNASDKTLIILITADRGLAGGIISRVIEQAKKELLRYGIEHCDVITVGKKGEDAMRRMNALLVASFGMPKSKPTLADIIPITQIALGDFAAAKYHRVVVVWSDYQSALVQKAQRRVILPITQEEIKETIEEIDANLQPLHLDAKTAATEYIFEPSAASVLNAMLTRLVEMQMYQLLLEANASEHAARMLTMKNASDAAQDLIDDFTFEYNQARQARITQDLTELSAARLALE